jgi:glycine/D-amino acid oxidase-like deaminating enzyme
MDVAVVGGGIGGLSLALQLERAGIDCRVYESVPAYAPLGVGINLFPHAACGWRYSLWLRKAMVQPHDGGVPKLL